MATSDIVIVGGGILGIASALALRSRGASVTVLEPGPLPHPDASSTDISKLVRADYAKDAFYSDLMEDSFEGFRAWNMELGETLFHETGLLVLCRSKLEEGSFEGDCFALLSERDYPLRLLRGAEISRRIPAIRDGAYETAYINERGGWAESGKLVARLASEAIAKGVVIREGVAVKPLGAPKRDAARVVTTEKGETIAFGTLVVAAGAFTPVLLPELADRMTPVGQSVFHFLPEDPALFSVPTFLPWAADIAQSGFYGFPFHEGVLKVANHGRGIVVDPSGPRVVAADAEAKFRAFLRDAMPAAADAPVVRTRLCLYCDTFDGDFFIDHHPDRPGVMVASGGSGHMFKFAPALGRFVADLAENKGAPALRARFGFRAKGERRLEAARADR